MLDDLWMPGIVNSILLGDRPFHSHVNIPEVCSERVKLLGTSLFISDLAFMICWACPEKCFTEG